MISVQLVRRLAYEYVQQIVEMDKEMSIDMQQAEREAAEQTTGTEFGAAIKFLKENKIYDAQKVFDEVSGYICFFLFVNQSIPRGSATTEASHADTVYCGVLWQWTGM